MATIENIQISHHRSTLDPPFVASWDGRARQHFDVTIVRVRDDEGREGVGSGDLMLGFAGHEDLFIGQDPTAIDRHFEVLNHLQFHYGRCWPLDLALWDLRGKIAGKPVWQMLGGTSRVPVYASSGVRRDSGALAETFERFVEEGFPAGKIRLAATGRGTESWRDDVRGLEGVRARIGDRLKLLVDCNQGWRMPWDTGASWTIDTALALVRELEHLDVYWVEEPLHRGDRAGMRKLREATDIKIAGGEMNRELYEYRDLIEDGCLDVLQPDAALIGGITGLRWIAAMARDAGITFTPHSWTNGIGVLANAHLAASVGSLPFLEYPYDPPEWTPERRDFGLAAPNRAKNGVLELTDVPGLGIELDEDALVATRV